MRGEWQVRGGSADGPGGPRRWLWQQLEGDQQSEHRLSALNWVIVAAIVAGVLVAVVRTEPTLAPAQRTALLAVDAVVGVIFLAEYLGRLWVAPQGAPQLPAGQARLRFAGSFHGLLDLVVLASFVLPFVSHDLAVLRIVALIRIMQLSRLNRLHRAFDTLWQAVLRRRFELLLTVFLAVVLMLFSATLLYWIEGPVAPEQFGSIPRALWWAVVTLTTIGYGDVYPTTPLGRVVASVVAFAGIGLIAMPTGILAAALSDAVQERRARRGPKGGDSGPPGG
jgi:voltage-gated potassium channel